ncbi:peptidoglycan-binding protein [Bradyrhizobium sp. CCGUVB1N3]|uniref:glycosyl hydrolase 108 family protein n=1 Tax=Bradyrhizobium sp. CCGUVB1N3 TaxID=2949629 RepID=UPI0020B37259|nr:glycosyl hydrolase 108 family protein [Bradyrhizobium sp. CCGUVB1N3]MCP3473105.1 peptidoglycan-binding protein [Bradyrhizobium sp. CCGUVB1N3]
MSESTAQQRVNWKSFECAEHAMVRIAFGPDEILVAPPTADAWQALAMVLGAHGYNIRTADTDSYNCRAITGGTEKSLHAYGIALDINWNTNPYKETPDQRKVRFSDQPTQDLRAQDVKRALADTDMTQAMIDDALAIRTVNKKRVFEWGGNWNSVKDTMHFEIDVKPDDLETGIDWSSVRGIQNGRPVPSRLMETRGGGSPLQGDIALGNFEKVHALIEKWEGGYTNHPRDPGGPTNMGITLKDLSAWRHAPVTADDVRNLTRDEALQIFRANYWTPVHGDEIPLPAAQVVYNTAVLSGTTRGIRLLQQVLGRGQNGLTVDGRMGSSTIDACLAADQKMLVEDYCSAYESYLRGLPIFDTFGRGWLNRLAEIRQTALGWAEAPEISSPDIAPRELQTTPVQAIELRFGDKGALVEGLQRKLTELGYSLGEIDGQFGTLTREALLAFQADNNVPPTGTLDAATQAAFARPQPRPLSRDRLSATSDDLRASGSQTIKAADNTKIAGWISSILGALGIGNSAAVQVINNNVATPAPPNLSQFLGEVQKLLTSPQLRADPANTQQVLDAAKQLQNFNVKQLVSPENIQILDNIRGLIPANVISSNPALSNFFQIVDGARGLTQFHTIFDALPGMFANDSTLQLLSKGLSAVAGSVIPGFGGSLATLAIGLAANYFSNRVIEARTRDHVTGANTSR